MIKHTPIHNGYIGDISDISKICEFYSAKDEVPVKYVCTSALLPTATQAVDVFYRDTPHPVFGNKYFGLYTTASDVNMITNADSIEEHTFALVRDDEGTLQYSTHRWDYKEFKNGNMIDGGRAYVSSSIRCKIHDYVVRDGEMVPKS